MLGNNMFAYCLNDPVNNDDYSGALTRRQIHDLVLLNIISLKLSEGRTTLKMSDTCIYYNKTDWLGGWGFCDLYDTVTGEVWELKRVTCNLDAAKTQLGRYLKGSLKYMPNKKLVQGGQLLEKGKEYSFIYSDESGTYDIKYWDNGNGILCYDYTYQKSANQGIKEAVAVAGLTTVACGVVFLGIMSISGGTATPAVIPFVTAAIANISNAA